MGHTLTMYDTGMDTRYYLDGQDSTIYTLEYTPKTPELVTQDYDPGLLEDGGERVDVAWRNVDEEIRVLITGAAKDDVIDNKHAIDRVLTHAGEYSASRGWGKVYLEFTPDGGTRGYMSEILSGWVEWDEAAFDDQWQGRAVEAIIHLTRRFYWESSEVNCPLTNVHGTSNPLVNELQTVDGHDDAGHSIYVEIDDTYAVGTLPAPMRLLIRNDTNDTKYLGMMQVGCAIFNDLTYDPFIEAESDILDTASPPGADEPPGSVWSGGSGLKITVSATAGLKAVWELSDSEMAKFGGRDYLLDARVPGKGVAGMEVRVDLAQFLGANTHVLWEGPWVALSSSHELQNLGVIPMPPVLVGVSGLWGLQIRLWARHTGAGTLYLDWIHFMPTEGIRGYLPIDGGVPYNWQLVDETCFGRVYSEYYTAPTAAAPNYHAVGTPLMIWPKKHHRLYFLFETQDYTAAKNMTGQTMTPTRTVKVEVRYTPRWLTP